MSANRRKFLKGLGAAALLPVLPAFSRKQQWHSVRPALIGS